MAKPIAADYTTMFLLPPSLEDLVPKDHPARFIREFVDALVLEELGFVVPACAEGRPPFHPSLLLKVWIYGYLNHLCSTRQLERACREHLSLLWLTGMNPPDHTTLWRFWNHNKQALRNVYKKSIHIAQKAGLVGLTLQAIDGTKIEASCSGYSAWSKDHMEKLLAQLDKVIDATESQIQETQSSQSGEYRLPESLSERQTLREEIKKGLQQLQETQRKSYHPKEPEARRMKCSGRSRFGYNGQAVVDSKAGIIVASDLNNNENDSGVLAAMLDEARENVTGGPVTQDAQNQPAQPITTADTGYAAAEDLAQAQARGHDVLAFPADCGSKKNTPYHHLNFIYDQTKDVFVCPQGKELSKECEKERRGGLKVYRCHCKECPVRGQCTNSSKGRTIEVGPHYQQIVELREKLKKPENYATLRRRGVIVEPVFARIKQHLGFRRWTVKGMAAVRSQWSFLCLMVNLMVLRKNWQVGSPKMG